MCTNTPISQPMMNMEVGFEKKVYFWPALGGGVGQSVIPLSEGGVQKWQKKASADIWMTP